MDPDNLTSMQNLKDNIVLIGMPGAGKSTLGVILAKALAYRFIDTDLLIQEKSGCRLQEIIEKQGNDCFLKLENKTVSEISTGRTVIATGGSVVYGIDAMKHLHDIGTVIYLKVSYEEIARRIADFRARGIAMGKHHSLRELYDERIPLYEENADLTVCAENAGAEENVMKIITALNINK